MAFKHQKAANNLNLNFYSTPVLRIGLLSTIQLYNDGNMGLLQFLQSKSIKSEKGYNPVPLATIKIVPFYKSFKPSPKPLGGLIIIFQGRSLINMFGRVPLSQTLISKGMHSLTQNQDILRYVLGQVSSISTLRTFYTLLLGVILQSIPSLRNSMMLEQVKKLTDVYNLVTLLQVKEQNRPSCSKQVYPLNLIGFLYTISIWQIRVLQQIELIESIVTLNGYFGIPSKGFAISIYATGLPSRSKLLNQCELAGK